MKFSIGDLFLVTVIAALAVSENRELKSEI